MKLCSIITYPTRNDAYTRYEDTNRVYYYFIPLDQVSQLIKNYTYDIITTTGENLIYRNIKIIDGSDADREFLLDKFFGYCDDTK